MEITQVRNATIIVEYNGNKFLIDPWLGPKNYMDGFEAGINSNIKQPRVELPFSLNQIIDVDCIIVTHIHPDHWDKFAEENINKDKKFFVQSETDKNYLTQKGFHNIEILSENGTIYNSTTIFKTPTQHGKREVVAPLCKQVGLPYEAMGLIFKAENEKTLYAAGDTIYCEEVKTTIDKFKPDIIIVNACGAKVINGELLIMNDEDVKKVLNQAKDSIVIASHMDTVSHLSVTRNDLKEMIKNDNITNLLIPDDGETINFLKN